MQRFFVVVLAIVALVAVSSVQGQNTSAIAIITGGSADPNVSGWVMFTKLNATYTQVDAFIQGITTNTNTNHGMHIHQFGDISLTNGTSTGTHWSNASQVHACYPNASRHWGDMGNWAVSAGGTVNQTKVLDLISWDGESLHGHAVVLHAMTDDCATISSSMGRLAFGVIGYTQGATGATYNNNATTLATCNLRPTQVIANNNVSGQFWFSDQGNNVTSVYGMVWGLNGTVHGVHIHTYGDLSNVNGTSAGGHWDTTGSPHRLPPTTPRHQGDLGRVQSFDATSGIAYYYYNVTGMFSVNDIIGRAMILHSNPDDGCDQASNGNSGARLASCTIGIAGASFVPAFNPPVAIVAQPGSNCTAPSPAPVPVPVPVPASTPTPTQVPGQAPTPTQVPGQVPTPASGPSTPGSSSASTLLVSVSLIIATIFAMLF